MASETQGNNMRIAGYKPASLVDGEGIRFAIFMTGCSHNCEGCHSPALQDYNHGKVISYEQLCNKIRHYKDWLDGITLSGGDPLFQLRATTEFLTYLKQQPDLNRLNVWLYTGYRYGSIPKTIRGLVDVIVDGRYEKTKTEAKYRGSNNQKIMVKYNNTTHFIERVYPGDRYVERRD